MALEVRDVSYTFGDRVALDRLCMDVAPGVITGLLGPNGAGKTTLIRLLLGVLPPGGGTIRLDGRDVDGAMRRRWGYMPQERGLYPAMTAGAQIVHFGRLHGLSKEDAVSRSEGLLGELGLGERWDDRTDKLSGGMQQRLQLAAALVHEPEVVILDEPFSGLDPVAVAELSETLRARAADGRTVLFSSHQLDLVQGLCEDIVMIDEGRAVLSGDVSRLRASSGQRQLRLHLRLHHADTRDWLSGLPVTLISERGGELRLAVPPDVDPLAILDAARSAGRVDDFGLDLPTLSQLFLDAVGRESR